jgi:histidyl-tRNA synthetase
VTTNSVKGFRDILPEEAAGRRAVLAAASELLAAYSYREVELPLLEHGELFARTIGESTDIVEKEMYAFEDRDGSLLALRPEGTASLVRAYIEAGLSRSLPVARLYYQGPMFRRERPQKGRFRQFTQVGAELIGRNDAGADAESISLAADICSAAGVEGFRIEINSLGDQHCRPAYREALVAFGREHAAELCDDCRNRIERNPLRLLDCKVEGCRALMGAAPMMDDQLCDPCRAHHDSVLEILAVTGVEVVARPSMVRGLDYYCRTAFELIADGLGSQDAIGGGGRYDGLVAKLGGPDLAGVGFALGVERMLMAAGSQATDAGPEILVAPLCARAAATAASLARRLRQAGRRVELGSADRRLKAQMKSADKTGVGFVVIIGEQELADGSATVRDMVAGQDLPACFPLAAGGVEAIAAMEAGGRDEA